MPRNPNGVDEVYDSQVAGNENSRRVVEAKREIGFAVAVLGIGLDAIIGLVVITRPTRVNDPSLDGTEEFAEALGESFLGTLLILLAILIAMVCGSIGAYLGSKVGKALLLLTGVLVVLSFVFQASI